MADSNPPADQTAAANDLPDAPLSDDQAIGMAEAHVVAASEHLKHAAGYLSDSGYSPDEDAKADAAEPDADEQGGPSDSDADEEKPAARAFPGSAQQRRSYAPGSVNSRTAAAMRGRP